MSVVSENQFLLHSLIMGAFILFVYDILRIIRRVIPHGGFWVAVEDLAFWTYCGAEVFLLMYHESNGTLRWFAVTGAMAGMFLYKKLFSRLFVKYVSLGLSKLLKGVGRILRWLFRPVGLAGRKVRRGTKHLMGRQKRFLKNRLTYFLKVLKINMKV